MRTPLRLALTALITGTLGLSPAVAQNKAVIQQLDQLIQQQELQSQIDALRKQLEQLHAKQAEAKRAAQPEPVKPAPVKPEASGGLQFQLTPAGPSPDAAMALKHLLMKSSDPKVIGLARELLAQLEAQSAPKQPAQNQVKPVEVEVKLGSLKLESVHGVLLAPSQAGPSSLKLSADGKTAAVVAADGSITIYDVATGKEQLKFPAKK